MNYIQKILHRKKYLLLASVVLAILFVMIFQGAANSINKKVYYALYRLNGERAIDSNIVIINIDKSDLSKLKWPLKRNIYTHLINRLTELEAGKIGITIFLSPDSNYESTNNKPLLEEVSKSKNVVFASQLFGIRTLKDSVFADSVDYPLIKEGSPEIKTGHLNYLENNLLRIPTTVYYKKGVEYSFSSALTEKLRHVTENNGIMYLNLHSSWKSYRRYSLLEIIEKVDNSSSELKLLKGKYILIGVSDPEHARSITSAFDVFLPGIGLEALALDNILNGNAINKRHGQLFDSIGLLIIIFISFFKIRYKLTLILAILVFLLFSFLLLNLFNIIINYAFFLVPFISFSFSSFVMYLLEKRNIN